MAGALELNTTVVLAVATLGVAAMLLFVSVVSYLRLRSVKLLLAGGAFLILAAKGALWTYRSVFLREADVAGAALDAAVLAFLYGSVAAR